MRGPSLAVAVAAFVAAAALSGCSSSQECSLTVESRDGGTVSVHRQWEESSVRVETVEGEWHSEGSIGPDGSSMRSEGSAVTSVEEAGVRDEVQVAVVDADVVRVRESGDCPSLAEVSGLVAPPEIPELADLGPPASGASVDGAAPGTEPGAEPGGTDPEDPEEPEDPEDTEEPAGAPPEPTPGP